MCSIGSHSKQSLLSKGTNFYSIVQVSFPATLFLLIKLSHYWYHFWSWVFTCSKMRLMSDGGHLPSFYYLCCWQLNTLSHHFPDESLMIALRYFCCLLWMWTATSECHFTYELMSNSRTTVLTSSRWLVVDTSALDGE